MPRTPLVVAGAATAGIAAGAFAMTALSPKPLGYVAPTPPAMTLSQTPSPTATPSPTSAATMTRSGTTAPTAAAAKPTAQQMMPRMMGASESDAIAIFRDLGVRNVAIEDVPTSDDDQDGFVEWQNPGHRMPIGPNTHVTLGVLRWTGTNESRITASPQPASTSQPPVETNEGATDGSHAKDNVVWSPVLPESEGNQQPCQPPAVYVPKKNACATYRGKNA